MKDRDKMQMDLSAYGSNVPVPTIEKIEADWEKDNSHFDYDAVGILLAALAEKEAEITRLKGLLAEAVEVYEEWELTDATVTDDPDQYMETLSKECNDYKVILWKIKKELAKMSVKP